MFVIIVQLPVLLINLKCKKTWISSRLASSTGTLLILILCRRIKWSVLYTLLVFGSRVRVFLYCDILSKRKRSENWGWLNDRPELKLCSTVEPSPAPTHYCLKNAEEAKDILGRHAEKLDKFIAAFCNSFKEQERKGLRHHIVRERVLYYSLMQVTCSRWKEITARSLSSSGCSTCSLYKMSPVLAERFAPGT